MKKIQSWLMPCFAIVTAGILMAGCPDNDGPVEEFGEEIDDVADELDNQ